MRCRTLDFIEYASQMRDNYHAQLDCRSGSHAASFVKCFDHAIQRIVLAEEENVVLASEVVVKICRGKRSSRGNVAHAGLGKSAHAKLFPRSAQDFQAPRKVAPSKMAVSLTRLRSEERRVGKEYKYRWRQVSLKRIRVASD